MLTSQFCEPCCTKAIATPKAQKYDAQQFISELKQQVTTIVNDVISDPTNRRVTVLPDEAGKKKKK